jgi:hypothetical protein
MPIKRCCSIAMLNTVKTCDTNAMCNMDMWHYYIVPCGSIAMCNRDMWQYCNVQYRHVAVLQWAIETFDSIAMFNKDMWQFCNLQYNIWHKCNVQYGHVALLRCAMWQYCYVYRNIQEKCDSTALCNIEMGQYCNVKIDMWLYCNYGNRLLPEPSYNATASFAKRRLHKFVSVRGKKTETVSTDKIYTAICHTGNLF